MIQEVIFVDKQKLIDELEQALIRYNELSDELDKQMIAIEEEIDTVTGKKKYSNDLKRKEELKNRSANVLTEYDKVKINIEILRLRIKNLTQKIDFFNMKAS
jgi:chromosome segregation ATPase